MEHLGWGLQMTVLGMGLVFTLLAMLWAVLKVVLMLDRGEEELPVASSAAATDAPAPADCGDSEALPTVPLVNGMAADLVAAISIAVMRHKMILRGEAAPMMRTAQPGTQPSRWAAAGRVRQTTTWNPRGR